MMGCCLDVHRVGEQERSIQRIRIDIVDDVEGEYD